MALLGPRLHRCFVTPLSPNECGDRLRTPGTAAPPLGSVHRTGWRRELIGIESRVDGAAFVLAVGTPKQYQHLLIGPWVAHGVLRERPDGTLVELRVRPRAVVPPLLGLMFLAFVLALALLAANSAGWVPQGRVSDFVDRWRIPLMIGFPIMALGYLEHLLAKHRRDELGRLTAMLLEATEVTCGADPARFLADRAP